MFISSYNTYISTNTTNRTDKAGTNKSEDSSKSFTKYFNNPIIESKNSQNLPISYISNYKAFSNKQKIEQNLEQNLKNFTREKFSQIKTAQNMKEAYSENSKVFSLELLPKHTLSQLPKVDLKLPKNIQELKEENTRRSMIDTYIDNDNYYKITA